MCDSPLLYSAILPQLSRVANCANARAMAKFTPFRWDDPFNLDAQLTEDERLVRDTAEAYA